MQYLNFDEIAPSLKIAEYQNGYDEIQISTTQFYLKKDLCFTLLRSLEQYCLEFGAFTILNPCRGSKQEVTVIYAAHGRKKNRF